MDGITDSRDMSEQALGVGDGQGSQACSSPWGHKESDTTERLNNNNSNQGNYLSSCWSFLEYQSDWSEKANKRCEFAS